MIHATDGLLQEFLDGEIDGSAAAELSDHLDGCAACVGRLEAIRQTAAVAHGAFELLVVPPAPMLRARAALAAEHRRPARGLRAAGARGLAKAAMLLLALAGAGAAAIPGSPVRRALETTLARVAELFRGADEPPVAGAPASPAADGAPVLISTGAAVLPSDGRVRVVLHSPVAGTEIVVRLADSPRAEVDARTEAGGVRFRTGAGRIEVSNLSAGVVTLDIPRSVRNATIEIDGRTHVYKQGDVLQLSGPAGTGSGREVSFRVGT
jgi:hypothetical protein